MSAELQLTYCPESDCDMPAEVLDAYAEYYAPGGMPSDRGFTPLQRILHIRSRCLSGHILDRTEG